MERKTWWTKELRNYGTTELWNYRTIDLQNNGTTELWNYGTTQLQTGTMELRN